MSPRRTLKARLVNLAWRAFRPGSVGQRIVQWAAYLIVILGIAFAVSVIL